MLLFHCATVTKVCKAQSIGSYVKWSLIRKCEAVALRLNPPYKWTTHNIRVSLQRDSFTLGLSLIPVELVSVAVL